MDDLTEIKIHLAKIAQQQEVFLDRIRELIEDFKEHKIEDKLVEQRLGSLETKFTYATGAVATLVLVWGVLSNFVLAKLGLK